MGRLIDLARERAKRGLSAVPARALEPPPPPGYRRGDRVLLNHTGDVGTVFSHRWRADRERLALRLIVVTKTGAHAVGADCVTPLPATMESPNG